MGTAQERIHRQRGSQEGAQGLAGLLGTVVHLAPRSHKLNELAALPAWSRGGGVPTSSSPANQKSDPS
jgi:hypothetical protein